MISKYTIVRLSCEHWASKRRHVKNTSRFFVCSSSAFKVSIFGSVHTVVLSSSKFKKEIRKRKSLRVGLYLAGTFTSFGKRIFITPALKDLIEEEETFTVFPFLLRNAQSCYK